MEQELIEITGIVEKIIYQSNESGYAVAELAIDEAEYLTVVGTMPYLGEGETIHAYGTFTHHPNFGRQFRVTTYEKQLPATESTILKYLSSRAVKGIGPKTALKIVERFGVDAFDVIENHPEWLSEIPGISREKADSISEDFKMQFGVRSVMMFCRDFFGPTTAVNIYKKWGGAAVDVIRQNPYILCDEIYGVGFEKADNIAKTVGMPRNHILRIMSGIKYVLSHNANQNGHTYLPEDKLLQTAEKMLGVEREETEDALYSLIEEKSVYRIRLGGRRCVYLKRYYEAEKYISDKLSYLENTGSAIGVDNVGRFIDLVEAEEGIRYAELQRRAISYAVNSGVMLLTGGPGTGKTTIIRAVIRIFHQMGYRVALAAPTGRAAKRMSEATQEEARTIHRLLEMTYENEAYPKFNKNENNLLEEEAVIIDEASMIDVLLMEALLRAIKPGAKVIFIGDSDQLPSVGAGNVLGDLLESDRFASIRLTEIFRQAKESLIVTNAHAINHGEYPELDAKSNDFFFLSRDTDEAIAETVCSLYKTRLPKTYGEEITAGIQVITPSRRGAAGTENLNLKLQAALNPPDPHKKEKKVRDVIFREGDKVMQIKNNYDIVWVKNGVDGNGIFNGDIGTIKEISTHEEVVRIVFDDRLAEYDFTMLDELEHAYAVTVHKSQGSEYPVTIMPVYPYTPRLLTRNLLYTAVTRAQQMAILVGSEEIVRKMVDNNVHARRYTSLTHFLSQYEDTEPS